MNSTQLHYREATRLLERAHHFTYGDGADPVTGGALATEAQVHATLALTAAITEMTRQADPEAIATAVGVLRPVSDIRHHAHNAFGSST